jgi:hypothetical protein
MRQLRLSRARGTHLLAPVRGQWPGRWSAWLVDRAEQLKELEDLRRQGLLSTEEFEYQRGLVLAP